MERGQQRECRPGSAGSDREEQCHIPPLSVSVRGLRASHQFPGRGEGQTKEGELLFPPCLLCLQERLPLCPLPGHHIKRSPVHLTAVLLRQLLPRPLCW